MIQASLRTRRIFVIDGHQKRSIELRPNDFIAAGAVGEVYHLAPHGYAGACAKLYINPDYKLKEKLLAMIQKPPAHVISRSGNKDFVQFAWPTHLIEDERGQVIGFVMPEIDFQNTKSLITYTERREAARFLTPEQRCLPRRVAVATNMAALMADLHGQGHAFVDFKDTNVRIYPDQGLVGFVDTDGFRIEALDGKVFPGLYTTPTFNSPESVRGERTSLGEFHDRFVLAILIFRILNGGIHPFQGVPKQQLQNIAAFDLDEHIERQIYAYGAHGCSELAPTPGSMHEFWNSKTLAMFERTFTTRSVKDRISAVEWVRHLRELEKNGFARCQNHSADIEHVHFSGNRCPVCAIGLPATALNTTRKPVPASVAGSASVTPAPVPAQPSFPSAGVSSIQGGIKSSLPQGKSKSAVKKLLMLIIAAFLAALIFYSIIGKQNALSDRTDTPSSQSSDVFAASESGGAASSTNATTSSGSNSTASTSSSAYDDAIKAAEDAARSHEAQAAASAAAANTTTSGDMDLSNSGVTAGSKMMLAAIRGNLRAEPTLQSSILTELERGAEMIIIDGEIINDFIKIKSIKDETGWVGVNIIIPYDEGVDLLANDDPQQYINKNIDKLDKIKYWAYNIETAERPNLERDTSTSKWFSLNSQAEKNIGNSSKAFLNMTAAMIADPFNVESWIGLGFGAYDIHKNDVLDMTSKVAVRMDNGTTNSLVLRGLSLALNSRTNSDAKNYALNSFKQALILSRNKQNTEKILRALAAKDNTGAVKPIVEEAIVEQLRF